MKSDDIFIPLMGIWVFSASNDTIPICIDSKKVIPNRTVFQGWNGIGITGTNKTVEQGLRSVQANWSYLIGYNATIQQYDASDYEWTTRGKYQYHEVTTGILVIYEK